MSLVFRFADNQFARLPELATELVARRVTMICATGGSDSALAAKAATTTIPIVFVIPATRSSLVWCKACPAAGGNATGHQFLRDRGGRERLELMRELRAGATGVAVRHQFGQCSCALPP